MPQPPHPMAGAHGEGSPVAPSNWRWRCGRRLRDMYFYSPELKIYRSKKELAAYLGTLRDGPSPDDFCWTVTPETVTTGVWNKDATPPKPPRTPRKKAGKTATAKSSNKGKRSNKGADRAPRPPHPMAGAFGQGPPVAPPNWYWRCGRRQGDMAFTSPEWKRYQSRKQVAEYLGTLPDGPSADDFCWHVTPETVTPAVWNRDAKVWDRRDVIPPNAPSTTTSIAVTTDTEKSSKKAQLSDEGTNGSTEIPSPSTPPHILKRG